jgi:NAD(P)H-dependent flavin oxidoreductase YrpB (nitropropane dioxygenase family)
MSIPIIQGGMDIGISLSGLASTLSNMGGINAISSVRIELMIKSTVKIQKFILLKLWVKKLEKQGNNLWECLVLIK